MERAIVHLDIPDFFVAMEERRDAGLKGRALALALPHPRAIVQGVSANARKEGICEGMLLNRAKRLCPRLYTIPPNQLAYRKHHETLLERLTHYTPLVEGAHLGHFFLDLSGTRRLLGPPEDVAFSMEKELLREEGLPARAGLAGSKLVSHVAAHLGRSGDLRYIFPGLEEPFLHPLPVGAIPGIGEKTAKALLDLNIQSIGELSGLRAQDLCALFGKRGHRLLQMARGVDPTPVLPMHRSSERLSFLKSLGRSEIRREKIEAALLEMSEEAGWELRALNRSPGCFSLKVRYADGVVAGSQGSLPPDFSYIDLPLFRYLLASYESLPYRRVAVQSLSLDLSGLQVPLRQISLFQWDDSAGDKRLQDTLDHIRGKFGRSAILWGRAIP